MKTVDIADSFASLPFGEGEERIVRYLSGRLYNIRMELGKKKERVEWSGSLGSKWALVRLRHTGERIFYEQEDATEADEKAGAGLGAAKFSFGEEARN